MTLPVTQYRCQRCGHSFESDKESPVVCAKCGFEYVVPAWIQSAENLSSGAGVDLAHKSHGERHIEYQEREAHLARETLALLTKEGGPKDQIEFQQRRLAVAYMYLGEFELALRNSPDDATTERVKKLQHAAQIPDDEECDCKHLHAPNVGQVSRHVQTGWMRRNGEIVPIVRCSRCQHVNAGAKVPARTDDSRNRDPRFVQEFLRIAGRAGR